MNFRRNRKKVEFYALNGKFLYWTCWKALIFFCICSFWEIKKYCTNKWNCKHRAAPWQTLNLFFVSSIQKKIKWKSTLNHIALYFFRNFAKCRLKITWKYIFRVFRSVKSAANKVYTSRLLLLSCRHYEEMLTQQSRQFLSHIEIV